MQETGRKTVEIIEADASQAQLLRDISEQTFREAYGDKTDPQEMDEYVAFAFTLKAIEREFANAQSKFFLLRYAGEWTGYALVRWDERHEALEVERAIMLHRIYLLRQFWGLKLGSVLLEYIIEFARSEGYQWLWLAVWDQNQRGLAFYRKWGFEHFGYHRFYFGGQWYDDLALRKAL